MTKLDQDYITNLYQLFRLQHDLNGSRDYTEKQDIWESIISRVNQLDSQAKQLSIKCNMAIQNAVAYLAENKNYYYQNSERVIKDRILEIILQYQALTKNKGKRNNDNN